MKITLDTSAKHMAFANKIKDRAKFILVKATKRRLQNADQFLCQAHCTNAYKFAMADLEALKKYGLTSEIMSRFAILLSQYELFLPAPRSEIKNKTLATKGIKKGLLQTNSLLLTMDGLIRAIYDREPNIHDEYFAARKLPKATYNILSGRGSIKNAIGQPLPFVWVICETLNIKKKASKNGTFKLTLIPDGPHEFLFQYAGYEPVTLTINFTTGIMTEIEIIMHKLPY